MNMKRLFAALLTVLSLSFMSHAAKKECILNSPDSGISVKIRYSRAISPWFTMELTLRLALR